MATRGGQQRIPRPPSARAGGPPPWADLSPVDRRFTLAEVRERCAALAPPRLPPLVSPGSRSAAVLVPLFEADGPAGREAALVLTKRPEHLPHHQGEIAFPGGSLEPAVDRTLADAALRETEEEIGLPRAQVELVGELDGIATFASRFTIAPFVGVLEHEPVLVPDPREVEEILEVPLSELLDPEAFREERWDFGRLEIPENERSVYFYELPGETVWGATARILTGFLTHLTAERAARR
jgi:8-oxo-dGTP pyrophosphatase MutT (NUDIX family)